MASRGMVVAADAGAVALGKRGARIGSVQGLAARLAGGWVRLVALSGAWRWAR